MENMTQLAHCYTTEGLITCILNPADETVGVMPIRGNCAVELMPSFYTGYIIWELCQGNLTLVLWLVSYNRTTSHIKYIS